MASAETFNDRNYRVGSAPQPVTKRLIDADGPDFYPTPPWASRALLSYEEFTGDIWECACGDGAMSNVLEETGQTIISSDKYDRGLAIRASTS